MPDLNQGDGSVTRRWLLKVCATLGGSSTLAGWLPFLKLNSANVLKSADDSAPGARLEAKAGMQAKTHIAVIGAGAFGGWTALYLLRRGARVTLLEARGNRKPARKFWWRNSRDSRHLRPH